MPQSGRAEKRPTIGIVGGGIAGLVAAKTLAEAGCRVVVFEADPQLGGRASLPAEAEFEFRGRQWQFDLEHAAHGIWRQYRNVHRTLDEHGLLDRLVPVSEQELVSKDDADGLRVVEFGARIRTSGLPDLLALFKLMSMDGLAGRVVREGPHRFVGAGTELLHALAFDPERDIGRYDRLTVGDFLHAWPPVMRRLVTVLGHSAFFRDADQVSLATFLTGLHGYFIADKRDLHFGVLTTDIGTDLLRPLAGAIRARGGHVRLNTRVEGIEFDDQNPPRAKAVLARRRDARRAGRTAVDAVIIAVDPINFRRLIRDGPLAERLKESAIPRGVPSIIVRMWFDSAPSLERASAGVFHGLAADNFFWLHRLQTPFRAFHHATGGSVLECHLYARRARRSARLDDESIIQRTLETVGRVWPETSGRLIHGHVQRNAANNVAFAPGMMARLPPVRTPIGNLALAGDWIDCPLPVLYMERANATALLAARHVGLTCGMSPWDLPEPLPPYPPSPSVRQAMHLARAMRRSGLLPRIGRRWL